MPLILEPLTFAIICDGFELETHDAKEDGPNSIRAYVASEAGKLFSFSLSNKLSDLGLSFYFYIDGQHVHKGFLQAGQQGQVSGITKTTTTVLPFKFQDLQLVDPDVEDASVVPEMGTIELRAYRCRVRRFVPHVPDATNGLHQERVSERSKKAGWHQVRTADEAPCISGLAVCPDMVDPLNAPPFASVKIFYRPRELLMAQGVITRHGVGAGVGGGGSDANDRKRAREDHHSPCPSTKRRTGSTVKKGKMSADAHVQREQDQAKSSSLTAEQSGSSSAKHGLKSPSPIVIDLTLKRELKSPSPIVVDLTLRHGSRSPSPVVVDLTLDD